MYTSTPIHNIGHSNAPHRFLGHGYLPSVMSTYDQGLNNSDVTQPNLAVIIQDIQIKLKKLDLLDKVCERLTAIEKRVDTVDQDISHLKQLAQTQEEKLIYII